MAWRLTRHQEANSPRTSIDGLMQFAGRDLETFARVQHKILPFKHHRQLAREHEEELARMHVVVRYLGRARSHPLLNDVEFRGAHEIPGLAVRAPVVMFGVGRADLS